MGKTKLIPREVALQAVQPILNLLCPHEDPLYGVWRDMSYVVGSLRRGLSEVHDVDILTHKGPWKVADVAHVIRCGNKQGRFFINGVEVDVIQIPERVTLGAMMLHWTGSKEHNILMRQRAMEVGLKLNQYGLWSRDMEVRIDANTEEEIFAALDMEFVLPANR
jgi:DNA polymerase (family 10)